MILTVTLNPAIDKIYFVKKLHLGEVHRPESVIESPGGKGLNVTRVAHTLGTKVRATGFLGKVDSEIFHDFLSDMGIENRFMTVPGRVRTCINITDLDSKGCTEVLEAGPEIRQRDWETYLSQFPALLENIQVMTLSGSLPQGIPTDFYGKLIQLAHEKGIKVLLDSSQAPLLEGLKQLPYMIKPNRDERKALAQWLGVSAYEDVALLKALSQFGVAFPILSLGEKGAVALVENAVVRLSPPQIEAVNSVGSGDAFIAGCAYALDQGLAPIETLKWGMACGIANTQSAQTGVVSLKKVQNYYKEIKLEQEKYPKEEPLLLAIDQGTSGCKIAIFNTAGDVLCAVTMGYPTYYPKEGYVEQNPKDWWEATTCGILQLLTDHPEYARQIIGIGVDGTSWACLPIDASGNVLHPAMIWLDQRAVAESAWMKETFDEQQLFELSGNPINAAYITPKMLWLKKHQPDIYEKTHCFLQSNGYLVYQLTGVLSQDLSQGYGFHFFDMAQGTYDENVASLLGLDIQKVAPIVPCHEIVGNVTEAVAKLTGLRPGTPVVAGGLDAACCALGAGVIHQGQTQEQGGQAGGMSLFVDRPLMHPKLILGFHVIPNCWLLQGGTTGGGGTLNWFNRELGHTTFEALSQEAKAIAPGSDGMLYLPYMKGERSPLWNEKAQGVYYGLSFDKSRGHLIRSMLEGVAFSLRHNLETAEEVDAYASDLVSVGGAANSPVWTQIKADVTQKRIVVPYADHATSLGAAILAGVGTGIYKNFESGVRQTVKIYRTYEPQALNQSIYEQQYHKYLKLSGLLEQAMWSQ